MNTNRKPAAKSTTSSRNVVISSSELKSLIAAAVADAVKPVAADLAATRKTLAARDNAIADLESRIAAANVASAKDLKALEASLAQMPTNKDLKALEARIAAAIPDTKKVAETVAAALPKDLPEIVAKAEALITAVGEISDQVAGFGAGTADIIEQVEAHHAAVHAAIAETTAALAVSVEGLNAKTAAAAAQVATVAGQVSSAVDHIGKSLEKAMDKTVAAHKAELKTATEAVLKVTKELTEGAVTELINNATSRIVEANQKVASLSGTASDVIRVAMTAQATVSDLDKRARSIAAALSPETVASVQQSVADAKELHAQQLNQIEILSQQVESLRITSALLGPVAQSVVDLTYDKQSGAQKPASEGGR